MSLQEDQPSVQPSDQALGPPPNGPPPKEQAEVEEKPQAMNPCCCNWPLHSSVLLIAWTEFTWALISSIICAYVIFMCQEAISHVDSGTSKSYSYSEDYGLKQFWDDGAGIMLITLISLHGCELIASMFLVAAYSRRIRSMCFIWIVTITLLSLGIIGIIIYKQHYYSWAALVIVPFRFYFFVVVGALAAEIVIYPKGPPQQNRMYQRGGYGYARPYYRGGYYPGYGYGHGNGGCY